MVDTGVLFSSASNEWFTPAAYVEAARRVLGAIDLDPASCEEANKVVRAERYFTSADDGLAQPWSGRVWANPPYGRTHGRSAQAVWSEKLVAEYDAGRVTAAILLVNAYTERQWFRPLWRFPVCFTAHRIRFYRPGAAAESPVVGSAFIYLGPHPDVFARAFRQFGNVTASRNAICVECGGAVGGRADARTCSAACRQRAYRRRARSSTDAKFARSPARKDSAP